jgi:uncharacterized membrane protein YfcA
MFSFKDSPMTARPAARRLLSIPADTIGIWTSGLCVVHCILTPVLLSFSAVAAHFLPSEERTHRSLAVFIAMLGALALVRGYRSHRRLKVLWIMLAGLACIFAGAYWGDRLPSHSMEVMVTFAGSGLMITAHRMNHTFCRQCRACVPADACEK